MEIENINRNEYLAFAHLYFLCGRTITVQDAWCGEIRGRLELPFTEDSYNLRLGRLKVKLLKFENLEKIIIN